MFNGDYIVGEYWSQHELPITTLFFFPHNVFTRFSVDKKDVSRVLIWVTIDQTA